MESGADTHTYIYLMENWAGTITPDPGRLQIQAQQLSLTNEYGISLSIPAAVWTS